MSTRSSRLTSDLLVFLPILAYVAPQASIFVQRRCCRHRPGQKRQGQEGDFSVLRAKVSGLGVLNTFHTSGEL